MNNVTPITVAAGTTAYANVKFNETFCRSVPAAADVTVSVTATVGALTVQGGVTTAPVTAIVTVTYPVCAGGCTRSYQFAENVIVGVTGKATAMSATFSNVTFRMKGVDCCRAKGVEVDALLTLTSTAAS